MSTATAITRSPEPCEWCNGTGVEKFCPSYPDRCEGCEERTCTCCGGTGVEAAK